MYKVIHASLIAILAFGLSIFMSTAELLAESAIDHVASCSSGDQEACLRGAQLAQAAGDNALLATFIKIGCKLGNTISCSDEGMMLISGLAGETNIQRGVRLVRKGCADGYHRACTNLGYVYYTGTGVARDTQKAAELYQQGCEGGSGAACRNLGLMVLEGETSQTGKPSSQELFERACVLGEISVC